MATKPDMTDDKSTEQIADNFGVDLTVADDVDLPADPNFPEPFPEEQGRDEKGKFAKVDDEGEEEPDPKKEEEPVEEEPEEKKAAKVEEEEPAAEAGDEEPEGESELDAALTTIEKLKASNLVLEEIITPLIETDETTGERRYKTGVKALVDKIEAGVAEPEAMKELRDELAESGLDEQQIDAIFKVNQALQERRDQKTHASVINTRYNEVLSDFIENTSDFDKIYPTMKEIFEDLYGALPAQQQKSAIINGKIALKSVARMARKQLGFKDAVHVARQAGEEEGRKKAVRPKGGPKSVMRGSDSTGQKRQSHPSSGPRSEEDMTNDELADSIVSVEEITNDPLRKMFQ